MTYTIEQGVPMPSREDMPRSGPKPKYPWRSMQVGDSFAVPFAPNLYRAIRRAAESQYQTSGTRFRVMRVDEADGTQLIRAWRLS
jgi:hypothetical protein